LKKLLQFDLENIKETLWAFAFCIAMAGFMSSALGEWVVVPTIDRMLSPIAYSTATWPDMQTAMANTEHQLQTANVSTIVVAGELPAVTPTPSPTHVLEVLDNGNAYDGYWWFDAWVPGLPTYQSQFMRMPAISDGVAVFYAPQVMEANVKYHGLSMDGYVGAVAVPFCSEIGHEVWIQRQGDLLAYPLPSWAWEGPFIVADCTRRNDLYGVIMYRHQVVEVDFDTAVLWGMAQYGGNQNDGRWTMLSQPIPVRLSFVNPDRLSPGNWNFSLEDWFLVRVRYSTGPNEDRQSDFRPLNYRSPAAPGLLPEWLMDGEWITFP